MRFTRKNYDNIRQIFEKETGVSLGRTRESRARNRYSGVRRLASVAAAAVLVFTLAAFTYPLFSPLDGDALTLRGTYLGDGLVQVEVTNDSDKELVFQERVKLACWVHDEEVPTTGGRVHFDKTHFPAHTSGSLVIDLSEAYDIRALEEPHGNPEWYYLLLTNNGFLFGHDWMCSVSFAEQAEAAPAQKTTEEDNRAARLEQIEEELRFYFEEAYTGTPMAFNEANFRYQQKVEEVLTRFDGTIVPALSPDIMVGLPSVPLDPEPRMGKIPEGIVFDPGISEDQQYRLTWDDWEYTDGYGRMVASREEKAWTQVAVLPQREGETDGGVTLPLIFLFVYDAKEAVAENYAFIYGQILSFGELEAHLLLKDEHYAVYDATALIYEDLDAYLDDFLGSREDVYCDDQVRQRIHNIYEFYQDRDRVRDLYGYYEISEELG